jgi:hypothetical protein
MLAVSGVVAVTSSTAGAGVTDTRAARSSAMLTPPDMRMVVLKNRISIGIDGGRTYLHFSHVTSDFGPGPFEIDPDYDSQTGVATFTQRLYNSPSPGVWNKDHRVPLAAIGVYHPPSDYEFPLNSFVLLNARGRRVATSPKTDYCITGDYRLAHVENTPDQTFINPANCATATARLGWSVGWGDQYDQVDNGQPIDITGLPDGTYTLRGIVDPEHVLTETDKQNDVTDTVLKLAGMGGGSPTVTVVSQSRPDLLLPTVRITAPTAGQSVSGAVRLAADASAVRGRVTSVQFLVDGRPLGSPDTTAPYRRTWHTGAETTGRHYISARVTTNRGLMNSARPVRVALVAKVGAIGLDRSAPTVAVLNPPPRQLLSGTVPLAAYVTDDVGVAAVRYWVDGRLVGAAHRAPFAVRWRTARVPSGPHTLTVRVVDDAGHRATTRQRVVVENPRPAMTCFVVQSQVGAQGRGTVSTPGFRTAVRDEVLLAMVSADGPRGAAQSASVTGGGLAWHRVVRADHQAGDAEVWMATVHRVRQVGPVTSRLRYGGRAEKVTLVALEGVAGIGARAADSGVSGAPQLSLSATGAAASLFFAVGSAGAARRPVLPVGQIFAGLHVAPGADATFWSQYTNQAVSPAGTPVTVRALRPASAPWNLVAVEAVGEDE